MSTAFQTYEPHYGENVESYNGTPTSEAFYAQVKDRDFSCKRNIPVGERVLYLSTPQTDTPTITAGNLNFSTSDFSSLLQIKGSTAGADIRLPNYPVGCKLAIMNPEDNTSVAVRFSNGGAATTITQRLFVNGVITSDGVLTPYTA